MEAETTDPGLASKPSELLEVPSLYWEGHFYDRLPSSNPDCSSHAAHSGERVMKHRESGPRRREAARPKQAVSMDNGAFGGCRCVSADPPFPVKQEEPDEREGGGGMKVQGRAQLAVVKLGSWRRCATRAAVCEVGGCRGA